MDRRLTGPAIALTLAICAPALSQAIIGPSSFTRVAQQEHASQLVPEARAPFPLTPDNIVAAPAGGTEIARAPHEADEAPAGNSAENATSPREPGGAPAGSSAENARAPQKSGEVGGIEQPRQTRPSPAGKRWSSNNSIADRLNRQELSRITGATTAPRYQ